MEFLPTLISYPGDGVFRRQLCMSGHLRHLRYLTDKARHSGCGTKRPTSGGAVALCTGLDRPHSLWIMSQ